MLSPLFNLHGERGIKGFSLSDSTGCTVSAVSDAAQKQLLKQTERGRVRRGVRKGRATKHGGPFLVGTMNGCDGGGGSEQESMGPDSQYPPPGAPPRKGGRIPASASVQAG